MSNRFWDKVSRTDSCWEWTGAKRDGYGMFWFRSKTVSAHREAWRLSFSEIPKGMQVLHHCDNRPCVRPAHLFLGMQADNLQDAVNKGRLNRAEAGKKRSQSAKRDLLGRYT